MNQLTIQAVEDLNNLLVVLRADSEPDPSYLIDIYNIALASLYQAFNRMCYYHKSNAGLRVMTQKEVEEILEEDNLICFIGSQMTTIHQIRIAQYSSYPNFKDIMY